MGETNTIKSLPSFQGNQKSRRYKIWISEIFFILSIFFPSCFISLVDVTASATISFCLMKLTGIMTWRCFLRICQEKKNRRKKPKKFSKKIFRVIIRWYTCNWNLPGDCISWLEEGKGTFRKLNWCIYSNLCWVVSILCHFESLSYFSNKLVRYFVINLTLLLDLFGPHQMYQLPTNWAPQSCVPHTIKSFILVINCF